ncbi:MAG: hypothetical protein OHK0045_04530 [Raineya sp.]
MKSIDFFKFTLILHVSIHLLQAQNPTKDDSLFALLSQTHNQSKRIELLLNLSETASPREAIVYTQKALEIAKNLNQAYWISKSQWKLARAYEKSKEYSQSEKHFAQAEENALNTFSKKEIGHFYLEYGRMLGYQGKYQEAEKKYPRALRMFQEIGDEPMQAQTMYSLAVSWYRLGDYDRAEPLFEKAQYLFSKLSQKAEADCLTGIGACKEKKGEYDKALDYYLKAAKIKEENSPNQAYSEYLSIGNIYNFYLFSYDSALEYYKKAYDIGVSTNNKKIQAQALNNLGLIYEKQNHYEKAIESYQLALLYSKEVGYLYGQNYNYRNLANVYTKLGKHTEALAFREEAGKLLIEKIGDKSLIASNMRQAIVNLIALERFDEAEKKLEEALKIVKEIKEYKELPKIYEDFAMLAEARKDFPKALEYLKTAKKISDSIFTLQRNEQIIKLKTLYETEKKEQENLILTKENLLQKAKLEAKSLLQKQLELAAEKSEQENKTLQFQNELQEKEIKQKDLQQKITLAEKQKQYEETLRLKKENDLKEKVLSQSRQIIGIVSLAGIFLAILAYLFFNQKIKEVKAKKEIFEKNEELRQQNEEILAQAAQIEQQNKDIEARNAKIEVLLREIHHRVKNNMQTISSLLNLQSAQIQDEKAREAIQEGRNRVKAMAIIHQKLYQQENISQVKLQEYIEKLCQDLMYSYGYRPSEVEQKLDLEDVSLDIDKSIPLCLIINELLTNFYKYAVPNNLNPCLWVSLHKKNEDLHLIIKDNGKGMANLEEVQKGAVQSFGWKLINSLTRQLAAELHLQNNSGLEVKIILKNA